MAKTVHKLPANVGDMGSTAGSERFPGGGNSNSPQYSYLDSILVHVNPMDRGAWQATVHEVAKELNTAEWLSMHVSYNQINYTNIYKEQM